MKVTIKGHIAVQKCKYSGEVRYQYFSHDMSDIGFVKVMDYPIEVEIPDDFDPRPQQVDALNAEKKKLLAAPSGRLIQIEQEISELTCLKSA